MKVTHLNDAVILNFLSVSLPCGPRLRGWHHSFLGPDNMEVSLGAEVFYLAAPSGPRAEPTHTTATLWPCEHKSVPDFRAAPMRTVYSAHSTLAGDPVR